MTIALQVRPARTGAWPRHVGALALVALVLLAGFAPDVAELVRVWWTSTTYGHCLFVPPVIGWLVWTRRAELARLTPAAWWPGLLLVAAGGFGWLLGEAASIALARQLGLVLMLAGATVTLLGAQVARGLLFPLGYAVFLVPFGAELEPPLQDATAAMVMPMLHAAGVPASIDGVLIHAGPYWFEVAEACSGAKFVIAMLAFATLVAGTCFASWRRRAVFMAVALAVPVLANAVRAFGTIYAAQIWGVEAATGADHVVYGWVFFAIVMAAVMALGWRWFDRAPDAPAFDPATLRAPRSGRIALGPAAALVLGAAALFPLWAETAGRPAPLDHAVALPIVPGWARAPLEAPAWQPHYPGADHRLIGAYRDASGATVTLALAAFAGQREGAELVAFGTGVLAEGDRWVRVADEAPLAGGRVVRIVTAGPRGPVERVVATWYRVGDTVTASGGRVKLAATAARLTGGDQIAVAVHLSATGPGARTAIARFAAAAGGADRLSRPPGLN